MIDLNPNHLATVERILAEHVPECEVRAFGSRATWTAKDYSDIDLAIVGKGPLDWRTLGRLKEAFEESSLPMRVDVLDWHDISDSFQKVIERDYVVLQKRAKKKVRLAGSTSFGSMSATATLSVASQWRELPFSEAVQINPTVRLGRGETYPFVDMAAVNADSRSAKSAEEREFKGSGSKFQNGDTLMARITPCLENGKIARYQASGDKQEAHGSTEFIVIRGRAGVTDDDFAYYLTQWEEVRNYAIGQMTGTSGRQRVPVDCLDHLAVPLPPLPEQHAIAHVLGTLDDKIELNRRMNETLEAMARALFKSWFVDFDPVRAKMEGRWRRGESLPGLPADLYDLFPNRLVGSELGEVPEGWEVKALGEVVQVVKGRSYKSADLRDSKVALVTLKSVKRGGGYSPDGLKGYIGYYQPEQVVKVGDVVVAQTDVTQAAEVIGRTALVSDSPDYNTLVASLDLLVTRPTPPMTIDYLYRLLQSHAFISHALAHVNGTTVLHMQRDAVPRFRFVLPPESVIDSFSQRVSALASASESNVRDSYTLTRVRDALLPGLVSGEVRAVDFS